MLDRACLAEKLKRVEDESLRRRIVEFADGDGRRLLNVVEQLSHAAGLNTDRLIDEKLLENLLQQGLRRFDKGGDQFYDQISALHKSVRGSDPDAALYWFCRMLDGGPIPAIWRAASFAWPGRILVWPIPEPCS